MLSLLSVPTEPAHVAKVFLYQVLLLGCQVRLAFLQLVADWMLRLRERIDHHARLMPYALSALSDPSSQVQTAALQLMEDLGAQYEEEHKQELKVHSTAMPQHAQHDSSLHCLLGDNLLPWDESSQVHS